MKMKKTTYLGDYQNEKKGDKYDKKNQKKIRKFKRRRVRT